MQSKNKVSVIIGILILAGWTFYSLISGIMGLSKNGITEPTMNAETGKICEVEVSFATKAYEVTHTLNILIPTGKENFYYCLSDDGEGIPLLVKAKPSWFDSNFDKNGLALAPVTVKGEVMKMDSQFAKDLSDMNRQLSAMGLSVSTSKYISTSYKTPYTLRLISGLFTIVAAVVIVMMIKSGKGTKFVAVPAILAMLFMAFVILCGETV